MPDRFGTIFEVLKTKAIRHRIMQGNMATVCDILVNVRIGRPMPWGRWDLDYDGDSRKEVRCSKCYPNQRKAKSWPTSSKKK